jgi:hypothetical protein
LTENAKSTVGRSDQDRDQEFDAPKESEEVSWHQQPKELDTAVTPKNNHVNNKAQSELDFRGRYSMFSLTTVVIGLLKLLVSKKSGEEVYYHMSIERIFLGKSTRVNTFPMSLTAKD